MEISDRRRRTSYKSRRQQRKRERAKRGEVKNNELAIDKQGEAIAVTVYIKKHDNGLTICRYFCYIEKGYNIHFFRSSFAVDERAPVIIVQ